MDNRKGLVFLVVNGSFVDGHGIRTTVFLKGCPLQCIWCCNPEGQAFQPELKLTAAKCDGCGKCVTICPTRAIQLYFDKGDTKLQVDRELCTNCGKCIAACYTGALDCFGKYYTVDELFNVVKKDEQFYRSSGGGVTIGGGEATWQPEFTLQFIRKCKENYIHTALDTCGYVTSPEGIKALEEADLLLFDLKGMDSELHLKSTGVSNQIILENLIRVDAIGKSIIIRLPVIPGYTDSDQNLKHTAEFLSKLKSVERVDVMPVHEYGKVKYEQIGKEYKLNVQPIPQHRQEEIIDLFERYGLIAQIGG
jgi:pyruvate formate lyase activating enzyme